MKELVVGQLKLLLLTLRYRRNHVPVIIIMYNYSSSWPVSKSLENFNGFLLVNYFSWSELSTIMSKC